MRRGHASSASNDLASTSAWYSAASQCSSAQRSAATASLRGARQPTANISQSLCIVRARRAVVHARRRAHAHEERSHDGRVALLGAREVDHRLRREDAALSSAGPRTTSAEGAYAWEGGATHQRRGARHDARGGLLLEQWRVVDHAGERACSTAFSLPLRAGGQRSEQGSQDERVDDVVRHVSLRDGVEAAQHLATRAGRDHRPLSTRARRACARRRRLRIQRKLLREQNVERLLEVRLGDDGERRQRADLHAVAAHRTQPVSVPELCARRGAAAYGTLRS